MMGNLALVTEAPTRTSAPSTRASAAGTAAPAAIASAPAGNGGSPAGQDLPVRAAPPPRAEVDDIVRRLNELMAQRERNLNFRVDEASGRTVITVLDASTKQIVRQIPAEEVLVLARALEEAGSILDARI